MMYRNWKSTVATWVVVAGLLLAFWPAGAQAQAGGWEWLNPLPTGNTLSGVWGSSGSDVFALSRAGSQSSAHSPPRLLCLHPALCARGITISHAYYVSEVILKDKGQVHLVHHEHLDSCLAHIATAVGRCQCDDVIPERQGD
jgi:hypothetical protein